MNPTITRLNSRVLAQLYSALWAIVPEKLELILSIADDHAAGIRMTSDEIKAALEGRSQPPIERTIVDAVQVLPVFGTLSARQNMLSDFSGGTSAEMLSKQLRAALMDPQISAIVLDIDSPGGTVSGNTEFAAEVFAARDRKPIVAFANDLAASAAYLIGSAASEFWSMPTGSVGSIGVLIGHTDVSAAEAQQGLKTTLISAGRLKVETSPYSPLSEEGRGLLQARVDEAYAGMTTAIAKYRAAPVADVRGGFGEGAVVSAKDAKGMGMIDQIGSMDAAISRASSLGRKNRQAMRAWNESHLLRL